MAAGTTASNILLCACGKGDTTFTTSCSGLRNGCPSRGKCWGYILEWLRLPFSTYCPHCYHFTHYDTSLYVRRCRFGMRLLYLRWSCQKAKLHNVVVLPMSLLPKCFWSEQGKLDILVYFTVNTAIVDTTVENMLLVHSFVLCPENFWCRTRLIP